VAGGLPAGGALQEACGGSSNCMQVVNTLCGGRLDCIAGIAKQVAASVKFPPALASCSCSQKQGHSGPA